MQGISGLIHTAFLGPRGGYWPGEKQKIRLKNKKKLGETERGNKVPGSGLVELKEEVRFLHTDTREKKKKKECRVWKLNTDGLGRSWLLGSEAVSVGNHQCRLPAVDCRADWRDRNSNLPPFS